MFLIIRNGIELPKYQSEELTKEQPMMGRCCRMEYKCYWRNVDDKIIYDKTAYEKRFGHTIHKSSIASGA